MSHVTRRPRRAHPGSAVPCETCRTLTTHPRRGQCFRCYQRARRGAVVDACAVCGLSDCRMLVRRVMRDGMHVLCGNHAAVLGKRWVTLAELAREMVAPGDRRQNDRRGGDRRRVFDRRASVDLAWLLDDGEERRAGGRRASDAA